MDSSLFIELPATQLKPGQHISGRILWALDTPPQEIYLVLGWTTEGRGTRDSKIESEQTWETEQTSGEEVFNFILPASPYSFEGTLISVKWALELSLKKGKSTDHLPLTVCPHEANIVLESVANEGKRKPFSIFKS